MNEIIERVTLAIKQAGGKFVIARDDIAAKEIARVAIETMREPTEAMLIAAMRRVGYEAGQHADAIWQTMIDEASK